MVKLVKREGKMVLPSNKIDYDKESARQRIYKTLGRKGITNICFTPIRKDGTRGVSFLMDGVKGSYTYLTDIR